MEGKEKGKYGYIRVHGVLANNGDGFSPVLLKQFEFMAAIAFKRFFQVSMRLY